MDFITHLPVSSGKTVIWVIVDLLTKYAHFIALSPKFTAESLALVFLQNVYRLHGMPKSIVSDRDRVFLSDFWRELFRLSGTTLAFSTAYHPQTDGQTEVLNRVLETYLRCFVAEEPKSWGKYLHLAEHWYNTSHHTSIGMSPFRALYGRHPPSILKYLDASSSVAAVDDLLRVHRDVIALVKHHLSRAQQRMKTLADAHRQEHSFAEGAWVWLRLQSYRQRSVHRRVSQKLGRRYFGPFQVLRRIGSVAYKLDLPSGARIHPVFHVSLLKPFIGIPPVQCGSLPPDSMGQTHSRQPLQILGYRSGPSSPQPQILVQWAEQEEGDATWVPLAEFRAAHPDFDLEGKVRIDDGSNDTAQSDKWAEKPKTRDTSPTDEIQASTTRRRSNRPTQRPIKLLDYY
ncbi:UNVERIFIED_CONTAM: hypothetical protein Sradi_1498800 [Sesamum radiatum]|uniref:Integrase catalytic domain-containing protein n=1 Tax=Sesamum radiatum TaxID=300843 RepID=A0AAW2U6G5_SESRA